MSDKPIISEMWNLEGNEDRSAALEAMVNKEIPSKCPLTRTCDPDVTRLGSNHYAMAHDEHCPLAGA